LGVSPDFDLAEARLWAQEIRREVSRGGDPASGVQARKAAPTFRELAAEWQSNHAELNRSGKVRGDDRSILKLYVHPVIGDMRLMAAPFLLSGSEQGPHAPGPLLAQHTEDVFRGIVGLDAAEYAALEAQGVFK